MRGLGALLLLGLLVDGCAAPSRTKGGLTSVQLNPADLDAAYKPRRFALLVGIPRVADPEWQPLRFAKKDAEEFSAVLADPKRGHFDRVWVLTSEAETTSAGILQAILRMSREANRPSDVVVLYISAHGTLARDDRGELRRYLVTQDARFRDVAHTALSMDHLKQRFDQIASLRRVMILATCHSGSGKSLLPPEISNELASIKGNFFAQPLESSSRASMIFSASDFGETAREDAVLQNDIYTHYFIEALTGRGDRNGDGAVVATEAHDYARTRTFAFTEGRQRPSAEILEVGADPIILSGSVVREGAPELFSYARQLDGSTLAIDGTRSGELPGGATVSPGKHRVQIIKGSELLVSKEVDLSAGMRLPLESLMLPERSAGVVSLFAGGFSFLDNASRNQILPLSLSTGVSLRLGDYPFRGYSWSIDAAGSAADGKLLLDRGPPLGVQSRGLLVGTSVSREWRFGAFGVLTGPKVAGVWFRRSFHLETYRGTQGYFTFAPGWMGLVAWKPSQSIEVGLMIQLLLTYVRLDNAGKFLGLAGVTAGVGYSF